jgi:hypothetical protein
MLDPDDVFAILENVVLEPRPTGPWTDYERWLIRHYVDRYYVDYREVADEGPTPSS